MKRETLTVHSTAKKQMRVKKFFYKNTKAKYLASTEHFTIGYRVHSPVNWLRNIILET